MPRSRDNGLKMLQTICAAALLLGPTLVAAQAQDPDTTELFHPNRYIVEFSDAGSARFRKRDGTRVSRQSIMCSDRGSHC